MIACLYAALAAVACALPPLVLTARVPGRRGGSAGVRRAARSAPRRTRRAARRELAAECTRLMPTLIDVVALGLSAWLSFDAALELYCTRFDNCLAREFSQAMLLWQTGIEDRRGALSDMARRLGSPAIGRFADAVSEALAFGTPLASVLAHQATALREEHRRMVEEQIEKAPVKMLIPLGTLIVPAMLLAILGPLLSSAVGFG